MLLAALPVYAQSTGSDPASPSKPLLLQWFMEKQRGFAAQCQSQF